MEDSKKKPIMIGVIVVSLVIAGAIFFTSGRKKSGIESLRGNPIWMKCKKCKAEYEIDQADYLTFIRDNQVSTNVPGMPCEKCEVEKAYEAYKCPNSTCGKIFRAKGGGTDFKDRCPYCKFSQRESGVR